ncbi:hypothetical protein OENI_420009 [Oenococcus oeni]|nr:hypothetical protein OENI_420009 [Oenococcus oeni]SYW09668.1 hypothetical protein OENI_10193 [Oenococcus oeni]SYW15180.1 hypothetical protein OENI_90089 [Oenococcus oeni]SYW15929.1 hypothetical protein OENI_20005 [Oenococcus oeni]
MYIWIKLALLFLNIYHIKDYLKDERICIGTKFNFKQRNFFA